MKIEDRLDSGSKLHHYLIERSQVGDRKAQNELYTLYYKAMYNICRRMLTDEDEAKDALQESFIQAFTRIRSLKDPSLFGGWLKRIVVNSCIDLLRKRKEFHSIDGERDDFMEDDQSSEQEWKAYQAGKIMKALDKISVGCKTVLNLYVFEGYDHQEIAEILSISEVTSRSQYAKAKQKIKHVLMNEMEAL